METIDDDSNNNNNNNVTFDYSDNIMIISIHQLRTANSLDDNIKMLQRI